MRAYVLLVVTALLCASCKTDPASPTPASPSPSVAAGQTSSVPPASSSLVVAAPAEAAKAYCLTSAESIQYAKPHTNADPPFANCATGIFAHCDEGKNERGHLCSKPLDAQATESARKTKPDTCCYRMD